MQMARLLPLLLHPLPLADNLIDDRCRRYISSAVIDELCGRGSDLVFNHPGNALRGGYCAGQRCVEIAYCSAQCGVSGACYEYLARCYHNYDFLRRGATFTGLSILALVTGSAGFLAGAGTGAG